MTTDCNCEQGTSARGWMASLMAACRGSRALPAFGAISFLESSLLPVPIDLAMVPLCMARPRQVWLIVLVGAVGSLLGAIFGYLIGAFFMEAIGNWLLGVYGIQDDFEQFRMLYDEKGWVAVAAAGITPVPFKVAAILSGAAGMRFDLFFAAAFGIRLLRFSLMAALIRIFGSGLQKILHRHTRKFTLFLVALTLLSFLFVPMLL